MKRKNLLFVVMTALFLLVSPGLRAASSGSCGTSVTWTLDDQGVLTIEGMGAMNNYENEKFAPWRANSIEGQIKQVVIKDGVTTIGNYAFQYCENMTSVTIPSTVTSIGADAFYQCSGLTSVTIPSTVTELKEFAFYRAGLTSVTIPESVTSIGTCVFAECTGLTSVTLPSTMTSIGEMAFALCTGLKSVTIPNSVTSIEDDAFSGCIGLEKIESLAATPPACTEYTFYNVDKDKCVLSVPENSIAAYKAANGWKEFTNIEAAANSVVASGDCGANVTWTLDGDGVLTIEGTGAMTDYNSSTPWANLTVTKVVIKDGVTTIGIKAFSNSDELTSVDIPSTVTSIGESAFFECEGLTSVTIPNSVTSIGDDAFSDCTGLESVTLSNSLTSIASGLFYNCTALTGVEIPNSVTSIEKAAFAQCEELKSVTLSNSLTTIVKNAFAKCSALTSVTFPETLTSIGSGAFANCSALTSVTIPASVTIIEKGTFLSCSALTSVTIPNTVTNIGECAFYECEGLTSLTIPASVEGIGDEAFMDCKGLTKIESLSENPPACRNNAFSGIDTNKCTLYVPKKSIEAYKEADEWKDFTNIEALAAGTQSGTCGDNVTWTLDSEGVLTIEGTGVMADYSTTSPAPWKDLSITSVVIGDGVTTIGDYVFQDCEGLASVTIPASVTSIGSGAFANCTALTSVTIPASVTTIGWAAFFGCSELMKIESLAENPPVCGTDAFSGVDTDNCVLTVPGASVKAYRAADQWKDFSNIATGINGVAQENNAVVSASNGVITVTGAAGNAVTEVYSTTGALVYRGTGKTVNVPSAGMYVVRAAGKTVKVNAAR